MTSKFLKLKKKKKMIITIKTSRTYFNKKNIYIDHTWYEHLEIKTKEHLFIHFQIKRDRRKTSKEKLPLAWTYSSYWGNILGYKEICSIILET